MKKIGTYSVRGQVTEAETEAGLPQKILLYDGSIKTGYKIVSFVVWGASSNTSSNPDVMGKLGTTDTLNTSSVNFFNASDQRELAWAGSAGSTDTMFNSPPASIIDPDNLIVEDIFIYARSAAAEPCNYLITMEKYDITDWQGALAMVRNSAQNV
jgi:hypothetical protein|tara:strand:+ start:589 stop:1053 length:465 start_codon:yes stop_codon:yes gene_type:complete